MGTLERTETLTHRIGTNGRLSIKSISGTLRVRGVEGEEARLTVKYRIRAADQYSAERALDTGRVIVERGPGSLDVETPERRLSTGLAWLFAGARVGADFTVDVPWGTKVRYETMSGSIEAVALVGDQKYRTVSGDIRLWSLGGVVEAGSISGSISLDDGGDVRLRANTISGGIRVRARRFYGLTLSSTSGSIAVVGALDPSGDHRAESISGSVVLTPLSGVTAELRAVSGSIVSDVEHRLEGGRGRWRSIVGDGAAHFLVNSTSGSLRILAARPGDYVVAAAAPAAPSTPLHRRRQAHRRPLRRCLRRVAQTRSRRRRLNRRPARPPKSPDHRKPRKPGTQTNQATSSRTWRKTRSWPFSRRWREARSAWMRQPSASSGRGGRAMSGELEALLKLVSEGKLTAEEAAPIVAALEEQARTRGAAETGGPTGGATGPSARDGERRRGSAEDALAGRRIRIFVAENGRPVINLQIPLAAAGFAIDQVPGLSPDHRSSIVEAIQTGMTGPILEVSDHGDEVRIVIE